jgi:hypothetical protein
MVTLPPQRRPQGDAIAAGVGVRTDVRLPANSVAERAPRPAVPRRNQERRPLRGFPVLPMRRCGARRDRRRAPHHRGLTVGRRPTAPRPGSRKEDTVADEAISGITVADEAIPGITVADEAISGITVADEAIPGFNDFLRDRVLDLVGEISPGGLPVGGILGFVIGLFWPEGDHSEETWNSIKKYAEQLVADAIDAERITGLTKKMEGLSGVAASYRNTSFGTKQKGQFLSSLLSLLREGAPFFNDERNPEKMFPLFTSFGTLWITALAEQAYLYEQIYLEPHTDKERHLKELTDNIAKYTRLTQTTYDKLYAWRFSLLQIKEWQNVYTTQSDSEWTFVDKYGKGWSISSGRAGDWGHSFHNPAGQRQIETIASNRVAWINGDFVENLQATLAVARLWPYLDAAAPRPLRRAVVTAQGPWGGLGGDAFADKPPGDASRITKIRVRHGSVVDCLELFYDGQSGGVHGNPQGGAVSELDLAPDESVVKVAGSAGLFIDALTFTTNKGRTVGGGGGGGQSFSSAGHPGWKDLSLFSLGGRSDSRRLTQLTLQWKYWTELLPYLPSYKRNGSPLVASSNIRLMAGEGSYVSQLVVEYSGTAAANEYFPKLGAAPITLQLHLPDQPGGQPALTDRQMVHIVTTESAAKDYCYLAKYSSDNLYYYTRSAGDRRQLWEVLKMIPSDGPVMPGEKVYLRNLEACAYLCPAGDYLGTRSEPFAWDVVPVR